MLPIFADSYGLVADEEIMQEFRDNKAYTISFDDNISTSAVPDSADEFEIYNNEGITVYVTGFSKDDYTKNIHFRIENLNHHDIIVGTSDYHV